MESVLEQDAVALGAESSSVHEGWGGAGQGGQEVLADWPGAQPFKIE